MTTTIKVNRKDLIAKLASVKDDNVSIAEVTINRQRLLEALKLQTQEDMLTLTYGLVSWEDKTKKHGHSIIDNEPCLQFSCNHTVMRFLNRPKQVRYGQEPKIKHLNFIDYRTETTTELTGTPIDPQELIKALSFVLPCVATEQTRPVLNCVMFESGKGIIKLVAADGFRLAIDHIAVKGILKHKVLIQLADIPRLLTFLRAVKPTGKGKSKEYPQVYLAYNDQSIRFATESGYIDLAKQAGTFPDYSKLIPTEGTQVEFIASDMLESVKALAHIAKNGSGIVRLNFATGKPCGKITLTAKYDDETSTECDAIVPASCKIALNYKYLLDLLNQCKQERVTMQVKSPSEPALFTIADGKQWIIMPMFVQWE